MNCTRMSPRRTGEVEPNVLAAGSVSATVHVGVILLTLFAWVEDGPVERPQQAFRGDEVETAYLPPLEAEPTEEAEEELEEPRRRPEAERERLAEEMVAPIPQDRAPESPGALRPVRLPPEQEHTVAQRPAKQTRKRKKTVRRRKAPRRPRQPERNALDALTNRDGGSITDKYTRAMNSIPDDTGEGEPGKLRPRGDGKRTLQTIGDSDALRRGRSHHAIPSRKRRAKVGKVIAGRGKTDGGCKLSDVAERMRSSARAVRACYERRLAVASGIRGRITVRWTIGTNGRVASAGVSASTVGDQRLAQCLVRTVRRLRFENASGRVCRAEWPFAFQPGAS